MPSDLTAPTTLINGKKIYMAFEFQKQINQKSISLRAPGATFIITSAAIFFISKQNFLVNCVFALRFRRAVITTLSLGPVEHRTGLFLFV